MFIHQQFRHSWPSLRCTCPTGTGAQDTNPAFTDEKMAAALAAIARRPSGRR